MDLVLNDHNSALEVTDEDVVNSVTIKGHNNQVTFHEGVQVPLIVVYGHNNFVFSQLMGAPHSSQACDNFAQLDSLIVKGHNNRFENLVAHSVELQGHNNMFSDLYC